MHWCGRRLYLGVHTDNIRSQTTYILTQFHVARERFCFGKLVTVLEKPTGCTLLYDTDVMCDVNVLDEKMLNHHSRIVSRIRCGTWNLLAFDK